MKSNFLKYVLFSTFVVVISVESQTVQAHDQIGILAGVNGPGATDLYEVGCFNDGNGVPARLELNIRGIGGFNAPLSVQAFRGGAAANTTDTTIGDANFSPIVGVEGGNGSYFMLVNHTGAGNVSYIIQYHCLTANQGHTGTGNTNLQNQ